MVNNYTKRSAQIRKRSLITRS